MTEETRIVKGGFRATLALIISVIALILSIMAYTSSIKEDELISGIKDLQTRMDQIKQESSKRFDKLREETGNALEELGKAVRKDKETEERTTK